MAKSDPKERDASAGAADAPDDRTVMNHDSGLGPAKEGTDRNAATSPGAVSADAPAGSSAGAFPGASSSDASSDLSAPARAEASGAQGSAQGTDLHARTDLAAGEPGTDLNAATELGAAESPTGLGRVSAAPAGAGTDLDAPTSADLAGSGTPPAAAPAPGGAGATQADPLVGQMMGPARLEKKLGQGGMGMVYLGTHLSLEKKVAVKLLPAHLAEKSAEYVDRFRREAVAAGKLEQENIVQVYDVNKAGDFWYIIMQFVEGTDLRDLVKAEGKVDIQTAAGYILQAAKGLRAAHEVGVVHRDIKPENILLTKNGICKIADFGLAGLGDSDLTRTGQTMGSPYYMSPEQCAGEMVDIRTDIYALGVTFYYLLTAKHPYTGETPVEIMHKHTTAAIPAPSKLDNAIPEAANLIIRRMMAKKRDERYVDPDELIADLEAFLHNPDEIPAGAMKAKPPLVDAKVGLAIAAALVILAFVVFVGLGGRGGPGGGAVLAAPTVTVAGVAVPLPPEGRAEAQDDWTTPLRIGALVLEEDADARERMQAARLQQALAARGVVAVDRENLDKILTELALAKTDLTDRQKRVQLGRLFNSHYFFDVRMEAGAPNSDGFVMVTVTVTRTGEMLPPAMAEVTTDAKGNIAPDQLVAMAREISNAIVEKYGVRGRIDALPADGPARLNVGRLAGVEAGQAYEILGDDDTVIGRLEVTAVEGDHAAAARLVEGERDRIRGGDRVRLARD